MATRGESTKHSLGGIETYAFVDPKSPTTFGDYRFYAKGKRNETIYVPTYDSHAIKIYTDTPAEITNPSSRENSTLRHELQHLHQRERQLQDNPNYAINKTNSSKYDQLRPVEGLSDFDSDLITNEFAKHFSYTLDPQEVNARGIQKAGDAIEQQNKLARSKITSDPRFADYEFELEKSRGRAKAPELDPNIGRSQAELAFQTQMAKENENLNPLSSVLHAIKKGDATRAAKDIKGAKKSIASDVARGVQSNVDYAQQVAQDAYSDKVIGPQRERAKRVIQTQADVETAKSARMAGGLGFGAFASDPISTSNVAMDVAGAMGDSRNRSDQMRKAGASLYNPMYSDSEQMMGDALLRGGGDEFQVDPSFLRVANQRTKDRQK